VGKGEIAVDLSTEGRDLPFGHDCDYWLNTEVGLTPQIEAGVDFSLQGDCGPLFNAKWRLVEEKEERPALALGVVGIGEDSTTQPYLLLSHSHGRGSWGAGVLSEDKTLLGMVGVDLSLTPTLCAVADHVGGQEGVTTLGLSWDIGRGWSAVGAHIREREAGESHWYLDLGYSAVCW
jgi:hypothetical protein